MTYFLIVILLADSLGFSLVDGMLSIGRFNFDTSSRASVLQVSWTWYWLVLKCCWQCCWNVCLLLIYSLRYASIIRSQVTTAKGVLLQLISKFESPDALLTYLSLYILTYMKYGNLELSGLFQTKHKLRPICFKKANILRVMYNF